MRLRSSTKSIHQMLLDRLDSVSTFVLQDVQNKKVSLNDLGMVSIFLFQSGKLLGKESLVRTSLELRDFLLLYLQNKKIPAYGLLEHPLSTLYSLSVWEEIDSNGNRSEIQKLANDYFTKFIGSSYYGTKSVELLYGAVGLAVALDRLIDVRTWITDYLKSNLTQINSQNGYLPLPEFSYHQYLPVGEHQCFNAGTAHGINGAFLMSIYLGEEEVANHLMKTLIAINSDAFQHFPTIWPYQKYLPDHVTRVQSAWCYGHPSIGLAFLRAWEKFPSPRTEEAKALGIEMLKFALPLKTTWNQSKDWHFCHGLSGIAQIALRSSEVLNDPYFLNLGMEAFEALPQDLNKWIGPETVGSKFSNILSGKLGTGLVITSFLTEEDAEWDRIFLLRF